MDPMILLRRLGGPVFALNPDLIERAEATPDTVITMVNGNKYLVCETLTEVTDLIREHRAQIIAAAEAMALSPSLLGSGPGASAANPASPGGTVVSSSRGAATPHLQDVSETAMVVPIRSREA
jgi:flagellar protein FlbD